MRAILFLILLSFTVVAIPENTPEYKAGVIADLKPYYKIGAMGNHTGYAVGVLDDLSKVVGFRVEYIQYATIRAVEDALVSGEIDIIPLIGHTEERARRYALTVPVVTEAVSLHVRASSTLTGALTTLPGKRVAVVDRSISAGFLHEHPDYGLVVTEYPTAVDAIFALLSGEVDYFLYPDSILKAESSGLGVVGRVKRVGNHLTEITARVAVHRKHTQLLKHLNIAINSYKSGDQYRDTYLEWFSTGDKFFDSDVVVAIVILVLSGIIIVKGKRRIEVLRETMSNLQEKANYDPLTGLPNRANILGSLMHAIESLEYQSIAVLFIDFDDFKCINDTLGHDVGDSFLKVIATNLTGIIKPPNQIGRLGGDEFAVLLKGPIGKPAINDKVTLIMESFREAKFINGVELRFTASIGIAIYPEDGTGVSTLIMRADTAMYHAKDSGKNSAAYFTDSMLNQLNRTIAVRRELSNALENNEFHMVYQTKVRLANSTVYGAEALIRWENPLLGYVGPDEFISVAERIGIIDELGLFVIRESLSVTAAAVEIFPKFVMAFNVSPRQFLSSTFYDSLVQAMSTTCVSGSSLEVEITEGLLLSSNKAVSETLNKIRGLGVGLAMDDFGTGYSSLSYLRKYPFTVVKIDRSFISFPGLQGCDVPLLKAMVSMAHELGLSVVAEGVEAESHHNLLRDLGCDYGQGYLYSKPIVRDEFLAYITPHD